MQTSIQERYQETMIRLAKQKQKQQQNVQRKRHRKTICFIAFVLIAIGVILLEPTP